MRPVTFLGLRAGGGPGWTPRARGTLRRWRQRGQLRDLGDHTLRDIGLRRDQWLHKTSKPVWW